VPEGQAGLREGLADVRAILVDALWEVRKIIVALRPSDLDDLGLIPAVSAYARNRLTEAGVAVEAHMERPERRLVRRRRRCSARAEGQQRRHAHA
jgi:signal transduction histidine kinase